MSSTEWGQNTPGYPGGGEQKSRVPGWVKLAILLLLLLALGWVLLLTIEYLRTGKPLGDLPGVPEPVVNLFDRPSFDYITSIDGINTPMGVAVGRDGKIYVTETSGERLIRIYDRRWNQVGSFAPPDTQPTARVPIYVAVNPEGDVYVSDRVSAIIYIFSSDGTPKGQLTPPAGFEDWHPLGLSFDDAGNLYVADVTPEKHRIVVIDPKGAVKLTFGTQGEADGQFWYPNGIAIDSQGRIFVADSNNGRMQAFDKDGKFLFKITRGMSPGDLSMPRGIAIDRQGRLLISDTSRGAVQVYRVSDTAGSTQGEAPIKFLGSFYGSPNDGVFFTFPNGLAIDGLGKAYVTDRANNRVQVWEY